MTANVLGRCPDCELFLGDKRRLVFQGASRLVPIETIEKLVHGSRRRIAVFKPNNDLQLALVFLDFHSSSRIVWVYRDYRDAVNSSVRRWGNAHRDIMLGISRGRSMHPGQQAIAEGMSDEVLARIRCLCHSGISAQEGAALLWYARNSLYFDLGLDSSDRVLLVNYEDTVTRPEECFARVFSFADAGFRPGYVRDVAASSIGREAPPVLDTEIEFLCRRMMTRFCGAYGADSLPVGAVSGAFALQSDDDSCFPVKRPG